MASRPCIPINIIIMDFSTNCISCRSPFEWSNKDLIKPQGSDYSFYNAVCPHCMDQLRKNELNDDWSMIMCGRMKDLLEKENKK